MKHSKRFWSDLFYVPKYEKVSDKAFLRMMLSSVFGILLCGICLAGLTWAWFTSSITSTANTITAADFSVKISINGSEALSDSGVYNLSGNSTVTVKAVGSATTGYCKVEFGGKAYYTVPLFTNSKSDTVKFTVDASVYSELKITPQWGTLANTQRKSIIGDTQNGLSSIPATGASTEPQANVSAVSPEAGQQATESGNTYAIIDTEQSSIPEASTAQPTTAESAESESSVSEAPEQREESSSSAVSTQPSSQETEPNKTTASEEQSESANDTTEAITSEPSVTGQSANETPKQTEESSSELSTQPSSQEAVSEEGTASESQSVTDTGTSGAVTSEP